MSEVSGVLVGCNAQSVSISGIADSQDNLISGSQSGGLAIADLVDGVAIQGSLIGTNVIGLVGIPNAFDGIHLVDKQCDGAQLHINVLIASMSDPALGNLVRGNVSNGTYAYCVPNALDIAGDIIGLSQDPAVAPGNRAGVVLEHSRIVRIGSNSAPNMIAGNDEQCVLVFGNSSASVEFVSNASFENGAPAVDPGNDSGTDGHAPNDAGDANEQMGSAASSPARPHRRQSARPHGRLAVYVRPSFAHKSR